MEWRSPSEGRLTLSATRTTIVALLALVLTFAGGFMAGAFVHRALTMRMHSPRAAQMMLHHLDLRLDLTDAQRAQIGEILERHQTQILGQLAAANVEIERVLTPEQRRRYAKMRMRLHGRP